MSKESHHLPDYETLKTTLLKYRGKILEEVHAANNLMSLLMKGTRRKWTRNEIEEIKIHLYHLSKSIPAFMVFLLPGGIILLPLLVEILDRRKKHLPIVQERRNKEVDIENSL
ncbi:MAG: hypothetical protein C0407_02550 [Desulfobacca sp.]|nr:hypothetical protein [Desulfobacca sp.]